MMMRWCCCCKYDVVVVVVVLDGVDDGDVYENLMCKTNVKEFRSGNCDYNALCCIHTYARTYVRT